MENGVGGSCLIRNVLEKYTFLETIKCITCIEQKAISFYEMFTRGQILAILRRECFKF